MTFARRLNDQECNEVKTHVCAGKEGPGREQHEEVGLKEEEALQLKELS